MKPGFAVWISGLPSSGKSTLAMALSHELSSRGINVAVLESDALRKIFTPHPRYDEEERAVFYGAMAHVGWLLTQHGVSVVFDATANRRSYRDQARQQIDRFLEVYVDCPLSVCMARDRKGIYRKAQEGTATTVPGIQAIYEPPEHPEVMVRGDLEKPEDAAQRVISKLIDKGYLENS